MYIYTLDALFRREFIFDRYKSFIWTERFNTYGDFELHIPSTQASRQAFKTGTFLACNRSNYVMRVKVTEDTTDEDGNAFLKVTGFSIEELFEDRVAFGVLGDLTTTPSWDITLPPAAAIRKIVHDICVLGILNEADKIPYIFEGSFMPESTIPEPIDPIILNLTPQSVYNAVAGIAATWSLGFRLLRFGDQSQIFFDVYAGSDRTTKQTLLNAVVFTPELENLRNTTELTSIDDYKNCAYVYSQAGFKVVYPQDVNPEVAGFDRRVLMVDASDITSDNSDVNAALIQRGLEELASHRSFTAFDGEINPNSNYVYGRDYYLGDLVEVRNIDGVTNEMRVTEQIFVSDEEGERSYPTLAVNLFIDTGSWLSWDANQVWADMGPTEYWENQ